MGAYSLAVGRVVAVADVEVNKEVVAAEEGVGDCREWRRRR
jgi:hypothetical protein